MTLEGRTEFFPGRSGESGITFCRGWEGPYGTELVLPFSLISVEPGQDRYSSRAQLWLDADGELWMISYLEGPCEWQGTFMGTDLKRAQERLRVVRELELQPRDAYRILAATEGLPRSQVERVVAEMLESNEFADEVCNLHSLQGAHDDEFYTVREFRDGSELHVLHPFSPEYEGVKVVKAYMSAHRR